MVCQPLTRGAPTTRTCQTSLNRHRPRRLPQPARCSASHGCARVKPRSPLSRPSQWRRTYENLDGGCTQVDGVPIEEEIDVVTVKYKHALRRLQAAIPSAVPELVLEPQMANEHNSMPCAYGFGRVVRWPWALQNGHRCCGS